MSSPAKRRKNRIARKRKASQAKARTNYWAIHMVRPADVFMFLRRVTPAIDFR